MLGLGGFALHFNLCCTCASTWPQSCWGAELTFKSIGNGGRVCSHRRLRGAPEAKDASSMHDSHGV